MQSCFTIKPEIAKGKAFITPAYLSTGKDVMIKGNEFYAMFIPDEGMWTTNLVDGINYIDRKIDEWINSNCERGEFGTTYHGLQVIPQYVSLSTTNQLHKLNAWLKSLPLNFNYKQLDDDITFMDDKPAMKEHRSKRLSYAIGPGDTRNYDMFMSTCYSSEDREKLEWAVGSVLCGESKNIQKFIVLYGDPGTGKSTFLDVVERIFEDYCNIVDIDALVSRSNAFGTSLFKSNPLVCIQHDADLSHIEKNDVLNSIVSHEKLVINEKNVKQYTMKLNAMIFIGTNEFVSIPDARKGITRRMIDVYPTGKTLPIDLYLKVKNGMKFETGAIAYKCMEVFRRVQKEDQNKYIKYRPAEMIRKTNLYTNFVSDKYFELCMEEDISQKDLYRMFKTYLDEAGFKFIPNMNVFRENMMPFYEEFKDRARIGGQQARSVFCGFKRDCVDETMSCVRNEEVSVDEVVGGDGDEGREKAVAKSDGGDIGGDQDSHIDRDGKGVWIRLSSAANVGNEFNMAVSDCPAQYSTAAGAPRKPWDECRTTLAEIDPFKEHYARPPINLICIDFDLKNGAGEKDLERNILEASKWPETYCETSKSGKGLHLYYWYTGDVTKLSSVYSPGVEVKVFTGKSSLRRKLWKCFNIAIATISSGLPLKEVDKKMVSEDVLLNERALRTFILRNLRKEYHAYTKPSIDFIKKALDDSYNGGVNYDVSDMFNAVLAFANNSSNSAEYCVKQVAKMHFKSEEASAYVKTGGNEEMTFFDIEVFPNVMILCYKEAGEGKETHRLFNPKPSEIEAFLKAKLVGYNNRKYDNHILYGRYMAYNNLDIYRLSRKLVDDDPKVQLAAGFSEAYNLSYLDVYDMCSKKQSLKKWEIELGIHHQENNHPWDEPLPREFWDEVADYCCNDVEATEAVFNKNKADFVAREILADLSGLSVNHTTRQHATRIIFGDDKHPELVYTDLSKEFPGYQYSKFFLEPELFNGYDPDDKKTWKTSEHSVYLGEPPSEGGYVVAKEGYYRSIGLLDIESLHPHTIIALNLFGKYTKNFAEIVEARLAIKHGDFEKARTMFNGRLAKYLDDKEMADALSYALKIVINSVYGYTSASFTNPFKDPRNVDNIVAKRGALFMILLTKTLDEKGIEWVHVKTDSIKIPNITPEIVDFVKEFGRKYGYNFDHESTYREMCLVNKSTYIAKGESGKHAGEWIGVAAQFQHPYVMKTLFTREPIAFDDICETKEVKTTMVIDFNEANADDHAYQFVGRIGRFIPVKEGCGGGTLLRDKGKQYEKQMEDYKKRKAEGKKCEEPSRYASVTGCDGYRWLDAEVLKEKPIEEVLDMVDMTYFRKLVDEARDTIAQYVDPDEFVRIGNATELEMAEMEFPPDDELPF